MPRFFKYSFILTILIVLTSCRMREEAKAVTEDGLAKEKLESRIGELTAKNASNLDDLMELGMLYLANDRFGDAKSTYDALLEEADKAELKSRVTFYLALIDLEDGKVDVAEVRFKEAVDQFPEAMPALYKLAELNFNKGEIEASVQWFSRMIELDQFNAYALLGRSRCYLTMGKRQEALADLLVMREANRDFKGGLGLLSQMLEENGETLNASLVRKEIVHGAVPPYPHDWLMELRKSSYDTKELGIFYEDYSNSGQDDIAIWFLNRIEELNPNDWNSKVLRGLKYANDGRTDLALGQYQEALKNGADRSLVYPLIVKCMLLLGKTNEAVAFGEEGLREVPDSVDLLVELAGASMVQFNIDRASEYFERALKLDPYHEKALQYYAAMLVKQGKLSDAEALLRRWVQVSPADPDSHLEFALLHFRRGDVDTAIQKLEGLSSLEWSDRSIEKLRRLAKVLREKNRRAALVCYQLLNEVRPADQEALIAEVELLVQLKQISKAMNLVDTLVQLQPNNLAVRIAAGDIYSMNSEMDRAEKEWRAALDLAKEDGNEKVRREINSRLRSL